MSEWISVKDRLPETSGRYLTYATTPDGSGSFTKDYKVLTFFVGEISWVCANSIVTHWMPLPEPPKE